MITLDFADILIILTYLSMLTEIIVFPVPSVASTFQLVVRKKSLPRNSLYTRIQNLKLLQKILFLFLPTLLSIIAYCLPLILIVVSAFSPGFVHKTETTGMVLIAFLLILVGRVISMYSVIQIRKNNRQTGESFELKTGNVFSFSRNPILVGMYITYIGMIMLFPYWFMLVAFAFYAGNMHFRVLIEESFLRCKFGDEYVNYKNQTKRYF